MNHNHFYIYNFDGWILQPYPLVSLIPLVNPIYKIYLTKFASLTVCYHSCHSVGRWFLLSTLSIRFTWRNSPASLCMIINSDIILVAINIIVAVFANLTILYNTIWSWPLSKILCLLFCSQCLPTIAMDWCLWYQIGDPVNASTSGASVTELLIPIRLADFTDFVNTTVLYLLLPDHISELDILFILYIR